MKYYSTNSEDMILYNIIFKYIQKGFFVDVGCGDGITNNNTLFLEKELKWNGICIEANHDLINILNENRISKIFNNCISNSDNNTLHFLKIEDDPLQSGIVSNISIDTLNKINNKNANIIDIKPSKLSNIIEGINTIDYLSIQLQGSELDCLLSLDFSKCHINIISVQDQTNYNDIQILLLSNGFQKWHKIGDNQIYFNKSLLNNNINITDNVFNDKWVFIQGLDIIGNDIGRLNTEQIKDLLTNKSDNNNILAINTLGFCKNKLNTLKHSKWFSNNDGIYIRSNYL